VFGYLPDSCMPSSHPKHVPTAFRPISSRATAR